MVDWRKNTTTVRVRRKCHARIKKIAASRNMQIIDVLETAFPKHSVVHFRETPAEEVQE